jgi:hypothetical protein
MSRINLPELQIEDIPMTIMDGKPEFASAGKEFFLWNCSLTISADPDDAEDWKIERIALVNEDYERGSHKVKRRFSEELKGELFAKAVMYFAERHQYQIIDHVIEHLPDVKDDAAHLDYEFYKVA